MSLKERYNMNYFPFQNNSTAQSFGSGYSQGYGNFMGQNPALPNIPLPPKTTKIYVTSQEDALARPAEPNSQISYFHQNGKMLFEVYTDQWGRKQLQSYSIIPYTETTEGKDFSAEIDGLKDRISTLEKLLNGGVNNVSAE